MLCTDIVAYVFDADVYCPDCIIEALIDAGVAAPGARGMSVEDALAQIAEASAINRLDEWSYDSGEFPKVIFADEDPGPCGRCHDPILEVGDDTAVAREVAMAWQELREINDGCARTIASWYQSADAPGLMTFVSTGEIVSDTLFRDELVPDYLDAPPAQQRALDMLCTYLHGRSSEGRVSTAPGWSRVWAR